MTSSDWHWPSSVKPGKLIVLPYADDLPHFKMNGTPFSLLPEKQIQFAVAGVYGGSVKRLAAMVKPRWGWLTGILFSPELVVARSTIDVDHAPLNSGNELRLPSSVVQRLNSAESAKKRRDRQTLKSALFGDAGALTVSCMLKPVESIVTSHFGKPRTLPSGRSYYHSGVDLRAYTGTPIQSTKEGVVVFAGHMTVPGNNVIVSHGGGLFSRYLHLSEIRVQEGDRIPAATVVGLAGATGRVEAAHLHWEMIWRGQYADPLMLREDWGPVCD